MIPNLHPNWEIRLKGVDHRYLLEYEGFNPNAKLLCTEELCSLTGLDTYVLLLVGSTRYLVQADKNVRSDDVRENGKVVTDYSPCTLCERRLLLDELGD